METEAKEVVKLIELHVKECSGKSLGVVTMSIPQMEIIDEQLQFLTSKRMRAFCADESKFLPPAASQKRLVDLDTLA